MSLLCHHVSIKRCDKLKSYEASFGSQTRLLKVVKPSFLYRQDYFNNVFEASFKKCHIIHEFDY